MKKLFAFLFITAAIVMADKASAQDCGGWIGGQISYWHSKNRGYTTNSFSIKPEGGYDFNKHWAVGLSMGLDYMKLKGENSDSKAFVFSIEPYARWKYLTAGPVTLFLDGGFGVACVDMTGFRVGIQPGMSVKITKHFNFLTHIGFLGYCKDYYNESDGDAFGIQLSSSNLSFGFFYSF